MPKLENKSAVKPVRAPSLLRATGVVSTMTMTSRLVGFMRDMLIAHLFGAAGGVDAFLVAFKIPNFMRRLFAEGAFSQAFIPVLSEYQQQRSQTEIQSFVARIAGSLGMVLLLITVLAILATPLLIHLFAPGFEQGSERFVMAATMLRITFPYLMLISLTAMAGAILNTYGAFAIPAFTPVLLNLCLIAAALWLAPLLPQPIEGLAWGVLIAGVVQLLFQFPFLYRLRLLPKPKIAWRDPGVQRVLKLMLPALFGVSISQINLLIDTIFASFLAVGSVSWLYYSNQLSNLPLGVFGVAIATVILPHLSKQHANKSIESFSASVDWAVRNILLLALPAAIGLILLAGPILTTLFHYGKFTTHDVIMSQQSLMAFALGLPAFMLIKIFASSFYARQNIRTPVLIGAWTMLTNIVLIILLIKPLAHAGLALATTLAAYLNAGLLLLTLRRRGIYRPSVGWRRFAGQLFVSNGLVIVLLIYYTAPLTSWLNWSWQQRAAHLALLVAGSVTCYLISTLALGIRLRDLTGNIQTENKNGRN